jgi:hypothetical protein
MGTKYLLDTNTVIYLLSNDYPADVSAELMKIINADDYLISVMTRIEMLGFNGFPDEMETIADFIANTFVIGLEEAIIQRTITLRKSIRIKIPDAIIAATALVYNLTLLTRNTQDFKNIPELQLLNPLMLVNQQ